MRYYYMDSVRAFFMILGIFIHTGQIYVTSLVNEREVNVFFDYLIFIIHTFRMHGFYIIAGFFAAMLIEKKGAKVFLFDRLIRLGIPMFTIGFTFNSFINYADFTIQSDIISLHYYLSGAWLWHLWFLGNLIIYIGLTAYLLIKYKTTINFISNAFIQISKRFFFPLMIVAQTVFFYIGYTVDKFLIHNFLFISFLDFFRYLPFYFLGYLLFTNRHFFESLITYERLKYHIFFSILILFTMSSYIIHADSLLEFITFRLIKMYLAVVFSLAFILLFKSIPLFNQHNVKIRKISDASYSIYLLHLPFMTLFFNLYKVQNPFMAFIMISLSTLIITYLLHVFIIQKFKFMSLLFNGYYPKTYKKEHSK